MVVVLVSVLVLVVVSGGVVVVLEVERLVVVVLVLVFVIVVFVDVIDVMVELVVVVVDVMVVVVIGKSGQSTARPVEALRPVTTSSSSDPSKFERRIIPLQASVQYTFSVPVALQDSIAIAIG